MNTYNKSLFLVVFSALCIWSIAQTSQSAEQKAEGENATNNGVTITQGPGASIPEGPEPQGGWFTPLYTVGGVVKSEYYDKAEETFVSQGESPFSVSLGSDNRWQMSLVNYWDDSKEKTTTNFVAYDGTNIFTALYSKYYLDTKTFSAVEKKKIMGAPTIGKGPFRSTGPLLWDYSGSLPLRRLSAWRRYKQNSQLLLSDLDTDPTAWCVRFQNPNA
jgi:hypothetical protein